RHADPAGVVHEPLELQLPAVPARPAAAAGGVTAGEGDGAVRVVAVVSGQVQGVGYRYYVRERATAAGLSGRALNLPDGRVEVLLLGPRAAVDAVAAALDGPDAPGTV